MSHVINGVAANGVPTGLTVMSDGDGPGIKAADLEPALQGLLDGEAFLLTRLNAPLVTFTTTTVTTWTAGVNDRRVELLGWGGGGGGGGGSPGGTASVSPTSCSGGGGGGALSRRVVVDVTPGTVYECQCGTAGSAGAVGSDGGDGGDSVFRVQGGAELARFGGAKGGRCGVITSATNNIMAFAPGGSPKPMFRPTCAAATATTPGSPSGFTWCFGPGFGGDGVNFNVISASPLVRAGADSLENFAGGAGGALGAFTTTWAPGGGGGGGAAGPGGAGGPGGTGGVGGSNSIAGLAGTAPASGPNANSGAGGGGGGSGGSGTPGAGAGAAGGAGATGKVTLRVIG